MKTNVDYKLKYRKFDLEVKEIEGKFFGKAVRDKFVLVDLLYDDVTNIEEVIEDLKMAVDECISLEKAIKYYIEKESEIHMKLLNLDEINSLNDGDIVYIKEIEYPWWQGTCSVEVKIYNNGKRLTSLIPKEKLNKSHGYSFWEFSKDDYRWILIYK
jgi:hypothetical protein